MPINSISSTKKFFISFTYKNNVFMNININNLKVLYVSRVQQPKHKKSIVACKVKDIHIRLFAEDPKPQNRLAYVILYMFQPHLHDALI